jgi:uncharacterized membrane protein YqhA
LVASLVLMVILARCENFVSGFDLKGQKYKPLNRISSDRH